MSERLPRAGMRRGGSALRLAAMGLEDGLLRDKDWRPLDGETCRVIAFRPLAGRVDGAEVKSSTLRLPYAAIDIEAPRLSGPTTGYISHKLDFLHLWQAFNDRGVAEDEEVIVIWNKSNLRRGLRWSSRAMPGLTVWLCPKHAYEVMNHPSFRPELSGLERFEATRPIEKWVPDVFE